MINRWYRCLTRASLESNCYWEHDMAYINILLIKINCCIEIRDMSKIVVKERRCKKRLKIKIQEMNLNLSILLSRFSRLGLMLYTFFSSTTFSFFILWLNGWETRKGYNQANRIKNTVVTAFTHLPYSKGI